MRNRAARALRVIAAVLLMLAVIAPSALALSAPVWINSNTKVYEYPSTSSRSIAVGRGLSVTLTAYSKGWGRLSYRGRTGYIPLKYVTLKNPIRGYLSASATVYRYAGSGSLGTAAAGTEVYVIGVDGSYAHIMSKSGKAFGYVKGSALTRTAPSASAGGGASSGASEVPASLRSATTSAGGSKIEYTIYVAQNLIGAPYAESADPPKTFDCAKFCYYCYGKAKSGILKGSSYSQGYDDRFQRIASIGELRRGDMVCFDTVDDDDLCDHVGIYLGGGYFIHASSAARRVMVSSLASGYYNSAFSWGRRIFDS